MSRLQQRIEAAESLEVRMGQLQKAAADIRRNIETDVDGDVLHRAAITLSILADDIRGIGADLCDLAVLDMNGMSN